MINPDTDADWLMPEPGALRWRAANGDEETARVLQRYEWSQQVRRWDWFDVPSFTEDSR